MKNEFEFEITGTEDDYRLKQRDNQGTITLARDRNIEGLVRIKEALEFWELHHSNEEKEKHKPEKISKIFSQKEMYDYLQYISYCQFYELNPLACVTLEGYQKYLKKDVKTHMGDCTKENYSCAKCQLMEIEINTQQAVNFMWTKTVGHCKKICLTECEGNK